MSLSIIMKINCISIIFWYVKKFTYQKYIQFGSKLTSKFLVQFLVQFTSIF